MLEMGKEELLREVYVLRDGKPRTRVEDQGKSEKPTDDLSNVVRSLMITTQPGNNVVI